MCLKGCPTRYRILLLFAYMTHPLWFLPILFYGWELFPLASFKTLHLWFWAVWIWKVRHDPTAKQANLIPQGKGLFSFFFFFLVGVGFLVFIVLGVVWASWICGLLSDINSENFLLLLHTSILFLLCPFPIHIPFVIVPQSSRILCVLLLASQWGSFCWISSGSPALSSTSCTPGFISVAAALGVQSFLWLLPRRPLLLPSPSVHVCCVLFPLEPLDESV